MACGPGTFHGAWWAWAKAPSGPPGPCWLSSEWPLCCWRSPGDSWGQNKVPQPETPRVRNCTAGKADIRYGSFPGGHPAGPRELQCPESFPYEETREPLSRACLEYVESLQVTRGELPTRWGARLARGGLGAARAELQMMARGMGASSHTEQGPLVLQKMPIGPDGALYRPPARVLSWPRWPPLPRPQAPRLGPGGLPRSLGPAWHRPWCFEDPRKDGPWGGPGDQ